MLYSIFFLLKRTSLLNYKTIGFRTIKWFALFSRDLQFYDDINWSSVVFFIELYTNLSLNFSQQNNALTFLYIVYKLLSHPKEQFYDAY